MNFENASEPITPPRPAADDVDRDERGNPEPTTIQIRSGGKRFIIHVFEEETEAEIRKGRWIVDANGLIVWSNVDKNVLGKTIRSNQVQWDYVHPEDVRRVQAEWQRALKLRKNFTMRFRLRRATGEYIEVIHRGKPVMCGEDFCGFKGTTEPVG